jgi:hypothetical protein
MCPVVTWSCGLIQQRMLVASYNQEAVPDVLALTICCLLESMFFLHFKGRLSTLFTYIRIMHPCWPVLILVPF